MIRVFILPALCLSIVFAFVIGAFHLQPTNNPAIGAFSACAIPCWQGLKVGVTSADEAVARIYAVGGLTVTQTPCFISDFCVLYTWRFAESQAVYAFVQVNYGRIASIDSANPGFTVGQALLAIEELPLTGGDLDMGLANQFNVNLHLADSRLILRTVAPCPGSYRALLEAPVRVLELEAPDQNGEFPRPMLDLLTFRRAFYRVCDAGNG